MNHRHALIAAALAAVCSTSTAADPTPAPSAAAAPAEQEQCYGIAKAGQNDCSTAKHSCAGLSKAHKDPGEWKMVVKGSCVKAGGSLTAGK